MPRWLRRSFLSLAATATTACSLLVGTDGLTSPPSSSDGAPNDAGLESTSSDSPFADAPTDTKVDAGGFCENRAARFCDDFEDEARGLSSYSLRTDLGTVARASIADAPSPTHALACTTTTTNDAHVTASRTLGAASGKVTLEFALRLQGAPAGGASEVGKLTLTGSDASVTIGLDVQNGAVVLAERGDLPDGGTWDEAVITGGPIGSGWVRVAIEVDHGPTRQASLSIGGVIVAMRTLDPRGPASGSLSMRLGLDHENVRLTAYFDDVVVLP